MVKKTVRIYLYHPSSHPVINNRVNSILKINADLFDMRELRLKMENRSIAVSLFFELNIIFKLLFKKKGIIHIFDFSFIFPFFIPILKLRGHKIIYDTGIIECELHFTFRNTLEQRNDNGLNHNNTYGGYSN